MPYAAPAVAGLETLGQVAPQPQPAAPSYPAPAAGPAPPDPNAPDYYRQFARYAANQAGIDPDRFERQIDQESGYAPDVITGKRRSSAGATGIAQFMPDTARGLGVDPLDPEAALTAAARLMAQNLQTFNGHQDAAEAAYNAGAGNILALTRQYHDDWRSHLDEAGLGETRNYLAVLEGGDATASASGSGGGRLPTNHTNGGPGTGTASADATAQSIAPLPEEIQPVAGAAVNAGPGTGEVYGPPNPAAPSGEPDNRPGGVLGFLKGVAQESLYGSAPGGPDAPVQTRQYENQGMGTVMGAPAKAVQQIPGEQNAPGPARAVFENAPYALIPGLGEESLAGRATTAIKLGLSQYAGQEGAGAAAKKLGASPAQVAQVKQAGGLLGQFGGGFLSIESVSKALGRALTPKEITLSRAYLAGALAPEQLPQDVRDAIHAAEPEPVAPTRPAGPGKALPGDAAAPYPFGPRGGPGEGDINAGSASEEPLRVFRPASSGELPEDNGVRRPVTPPGAPAVQSEGVGADNAPTIQGPVRTLASIVEERNQRLAKVGPENRANSATVGPQRQQASDEAIRQIARGVQDGSISISDPEYRNFRKGLNSREEDLFVHEQALASGDLPAGTPFGSEYGTEVEQRIYADRTATGAPAVQSEAPAEVQPTPAGGAKPNAGPATSGRAWGFLTTAEREAADALPAKVRAALPQTAPFAEIKGYLDAVGISTEGTKAEVIARYAELRNPTPQPKPTTDEEAFGGPETQTQAEARNASRVVAGAKGGESTQLRRRLQASIDKITEVRNGTATEAGPGLPNPANPLKPERPWPRNAVGMGQGGGGKRPFGEGEEPDYRNTNPDVRPAANMEEFKTAHEKDLANLAAAKEKAIAQSAQIKADLQAKEDAIIAAPKFDYGMRASTQELNRLLKLWEAAHPTPDQNVAPLGQQRMNVTEMGARDAALMRQGWTRDEKGAMQPPALDAPLSEAEASGKQPISPERAAALGNPDLADDAWAELKAGGAAARARWSRDAADVLGEKDARMEMWRQAALKQGWSEPTGVSHPGAGFPAEGEATIAGQPRLGEPPEGQARAAVSPEPANYTAGEAEPRTGWTLNQQKLQRALNENVPSGPQVPGSPQLPGPENAEVQPRLGEAPSGQSRATDSGGPANYSANSPKVTSKGISLPSRTTLAQIPAQLLAMPRTVLTMLHPPVFMLQNVAATIPHLATMFLGTSEHTGPIVSAFKALIDGITQNPEALAKLKADTIPKYRSIYPGIEDALHNTYIRRGLQGSEELAPHTWLENVPGMGRLFKGASDFFSMATTATRTTLFDEWVDGMHDRAVKIKAATGEWPGADKGFDPRDGYPDQQGAMNQAKWLKLATGRGNIPDALSGATAMALGPRLLAAEIERPFALAWLHHPGVTAGIARDLVLTYGTIAAFTAIAKYSGQFQVNLDPNSSDFLKWRAGPLHYDPVGSLGSGVIRLISQLYSGHATTSTGSSFPVSRGDTLTRYLLAHAAPTVNIANDIIHGKNQFDETELGWNWKSVYHETQAQAPIFAAQIAANMRQIGGWRGVAASAGQFLGPQSTYTTPAQALQTARQTALEGLQTTGKLPNVPEGTKYEDLGGGEANLVNQEVNAKNPDVVAASKDSREASGSLFQQKQDQRARSDAYYKPQLDQDYKNLLNGTLAPADVDKLVGSIRDQRRGEQHGIYADPTYQAAIATLPQNDLRRLENDYYNIPGEHTVGADANGVGGQTDWAAADAAQQAFKDKLRARDPKLAARFDDDMKNQPNSADLSPLLQLKQQVDAASKDYYALSDAEKQASDAGEKYKGEKPADYLRAHPDLNVARWIYAGTHLASAAAVDMALRHDAGKNDTAVQAAMADPSLKRDITMGGLQRPVNQSQQSQLAWNDSKNLVGGFLTDFDANARKTETAYEFGKGTTYESLGPKAKSYVDGQVSADKTRTLDANPQLNAWLAWWGHPSGTGDEKLRTTAAGQALQQIIAKYGKEPPYKGFTTYEFVTNP